MTNQEGWIELTNYLISISNTYRDGLLETHEVSNNQTSEIENLKTQIAQLQKVSDTMDTEVSLVDQTEAARKAKLFQLYYGITAEYTYLGQGDNMYGVGAGIRWLGLSLMAVPSLRINTTGPSFGLGLRLAYWF